MLLTKTYEAATMPTAASQIRLPGIGADDYANITKATLELDKFTDNGSVFVGTIFTAIFAFNKTANSCNDCGFLWSLPVSIEAIVSLSGTPKWSFNPIIEKAPNKVVKGDSLFWLVRGDYNTHLAAARLSIEYERVSLSDVERAILAFDMACDVTFG